MNEFNIADISLINSPRTGSGSDLLASYTLNLDVVSLRGCLFLRKGNGQLTTYGPRGKNTSGKPTQGNFTCPAFQAEVLERVIEIYEGMTGNELEDTVEGTA